MQLGVYIFLNSCTYPTLVSGTYWVIINWLNLLVCCCCMWWHSALQGKVFIQHGSCITAVNFEYYLSFKYYPPTVLLFSRPVSIYLLKTKYLILIDLLPKYFTAHNTNKEFGFLYWSSNRMLYYTHKFYLTA